MFTDIEEANIKEIILHNIYLEDFNYNKFVEYLLKTKSEREFFKYIEILNKLVINIYSEIN